MRCFIYVLYATGVLCASCLALCLLLALCAPVAHAQDAPAPADTVRINPARVDTARTDTVQADTARTDSLRPGDTAPPAPRGSDTSSATPTADDGAGNPVKMTARDSLIISFDDEGGDVGTLYGDATMDYQEVSLKANTIDLLFEESEIRAAGGPADQNISRPVFQRGGQEAFTGQELSYNLNTGRGRVVAARRAQSPGFIEGEVVKVLEDSTVFVRDGLYTTCDCPPGETPSYSLRSQRMKIENQKWVYTGPIQLYLFNVPMPLWLPFGYLPATEGRRSGPLPPRYGEDFRGFFLQDWGWYFAMNDYTDLQLRFGIWSQGSWSVNPLFRYRKRYAYDGNLNFDFTRQRVGESADPGFQSSIEGNLRWSHNQEINPTSRFNSSVTLVSSTDFLRRNTDSYQDAIRQQISSSMSYRKDWADQRFSISLSQQQQLDQGTAQLTLPSLTFSQSSFQPFERSTLGPGEDRRWYEQITTSYNLDVDNRYDFRPLNDSTGIEWYEALFSPSKYREATGEDEPFDFEATHSVPVSASFSSQNGQLTISPSVRFTSDWLIRTTRLTSVPTDTIEGDDGELEIIYRDEERSVPGFFADTRFNTSLSANTTFYGIFPVGVGPYQGVRHTVRPTLGFSYAPNFNDPFWGRTRLLTTEDGEVRREETDDPDELGDPILYDIVTGRRAPGNTEQRSLNFSVANVFETKRVRTDSTGEEESEVLRLFNLDARAGYNFAADSLKLSDISVSGRTDIGGLNLQANATFSPYQLNDARTQVVNEFVFGDGLRLARLTSFSTSFGTTFEGGRDSRGSSFGSAPRAEYSDVNQFDPDDTLDPGQFDEDLGAQRGQDRRTYPYRPNDYPDFSIPWRVDLDFRYSYSKRLIESSQTAIVNAGFDFSVTPLWRLGANSGYDFVRNEIVTTNLNVSRDLGCWQFSFRWVPFGEFQSYSFDLHLKTGPLRDLLRVQSPRSGGRGGRFGSLTRNIPGGGF